MNREAPEYLYYLTSAYVAATTFIQTMLDVDLHSSPILQYCPFDLQRALISAICILIKILNSSYASHFEVMQGRSLFNSAVLALRTISLRKNDFPDRLSEALVRIWRAAGSGTPGNQLTRSGYDPLNLQIRSRMSVSHTYDCVWRWRTTMTPQTVVAHGSPPLGTLGTPKAIATQSVLLHPSYQSDFSTDEFNDSSTLQDFDLFDSLGWAIDDESNFGL